MNLNLARIKGFTLVTSSPHPSYRAKIGMECVGTSGKVLTELEEAFADDTKDRILRKYGLSSIFGYHREVQQYRTLFLNNLKPDEINNSIVSHQESSLLNYLEAMQTKFQINGNLAQVFTYINTSLQ